jgi:hypothetical protein
VCIFQGVEIVDALKEQKPVGYCAELRGDGVTHIGLSSGNDNGRQFKLNWDQKYGSGASRKYLEREFLTEPFTRMFL